MSHNRRKKPQMTWGTSYANTLTFNYPLINPVTYTDIRDGTVFNTTPSGVDDVNLVGVDAYLTGEVKWIPTTGSAGISGWEGGTGWKAFIKWARAKNVIRFYPDASVGSYVSVYLAEPVDGIPQLEPDGTKAVTLTLKMSDGSSSFSGY